MRVEERLCSAVEEARRHRDAARDLAQVAPCRETVMDLGRAGLALHLAERKAASSGEKPDGPPPS